MCKFDNTGPKTAKGALVVPAAVGGIIDQLLEEAFCLVLFCMIVYLSILLYKYSNNAQAQKWSSTQTMLKCKSGHQI